MVKLTEKKVEVVQVELTKDEAAMLRGMLDRSYVAPYLTRAENDFRSKMVEELKQVLTPKVNASVINTGTIDWSKVISRDNLGFNVK